jgi:hypothetical protein
LRLTIQILHDILAQVVHETQATEKLRSSQLTINPGLDLLKKCQLLSGVLFGIFKIVL